MTKACQPGNEELFAERDGHAAVLGATKFPKTRRTCDRIRLHLPGRSDRMCPVPQASRSINGRRTTLSSSRKLFAPIRVNQNQVATDAKDDRDELMERTHRWQETQGWRSAQGDLSRPPEKAKTVPFGELLVNTQPVSEQSQARPAKRPRRKAARCRR